MKKKSPRLEGSGTILTLKSEGGSEREVSVNNSCSSPWAFINVSWCFQLWPPLPLPSSVSSNRRYNNHSSRNPLCCLPGAPPPSLENSFLCLSLRRPWECLCPVLSHLAWTSQGQSSWGYSRAGRVPGAASDLPILSQASASASLPHSPGN